MRFILAGFICLLVNGAFANSASPGLSLSQAQADTLLGSVVEYAFAPIESPPGAIPESSAFSASYHKEALNFGFRPERLWLRFNLTNTGNTDIQRLLNIRYPLLDRVGLYRFTDEGLQALGPAQGRTVAPDSQAEQTGSLGLPNRFFAFPITVPPGQNTYYLSVESKDSLAIPLYISSNSAFQTALYWDALGLASYFGPVLTNILFALFMLVQLRDREMLFYTACLVVNHLTFFALMERVPQVLFGWDSLFMNRDIIAINVCLSILMFTLFAREFLNLKVTLPWAFRWSRGAVVLMLITLVLATQLPHFYSITLASLSCMVVALFYSYVVVHLLIQKQPNTGRFITAWGFGLMGAMIYAGKVWNLLPVNFFTSYAWHMGSLAEAILFSLSIANRAAQERQHKLDAQNKLIFKEQALRATQEKLLQAESEAKKELELQVRERTQDLSRLLARLKSENKWLEELSINDALTQVRNRRFFDDMLQQLWNEAAERQTPLSIMLLDIDHFKQVNDQYGHLAGDICLQQVAETLRYCITHTNDVICRYGGEEFVVLLPNTRAEQAMALADKVRKAIAETQVHAEGHELHLTASFGVGCCIPKYNEDALALVSACDQALYQSKENGRNRATLTHQFEQAISHTASKAS